MERSRHGRPAKDAHYSMDRRLAATVARQARNEAQPRSGSKDARLSGAEAGPAAESGADIRDPGVGGRAREKRGAETGPQPPTPGPRRSAPRLAGQPAPASTTEDRLDSASEGGTESRPRGVRPPLHADRRFRRCRAQVRRGYRPAWFANFRRPLNRHRRLRRRSRRLGRRCRNHSRRGAATLALPKARIPARPGI